MRTYSIEEDYLGEFLDPVNYDLEVGEQDPSHQFCIDLAKEVGGRVLEVAFGTGLVILPLPTLGIEVAGLDIMLTVIEGTIGIAPVSTSYFNDYLHLVE